MTHIYYKNDKGGKVLVSMINALINFDLGHTYTLKTHKTDFNTETHASIPDGSYTVTDIEWIHHLARVNDINLHVTVQDK